MEIKDMIRELIDQSPVWSQNKIGTQLGLSKSAMSQRLGAKRVGIDFVVDVLNLLGYDLVAVPKGSNLPRGSVVVDPSAED